jgi:hypothetical protein
MTAWTAPYRRHGGVRRRRRFTQMLSGVDGPYTFSPSLCNQSVRVIRILVNSHVDLHSLSSTRVPRLSSASTVGDDRTPWRRPSSMTAWTAPWKRPLAATVVGTRGTVPRRADSAAQHQWFFFLPLTVEPRAVGVGACGCLALP